MTAICIIITIVLFILVLWSIGEDIRRIINRKDNGKKKTIWHPKSERPQSHSTILFYGFYNESVGTYQESGKVYTNETPDGEIYEWKEIGEKWCYWDDVLNL